MDWYHLALFVHLGALLAAIAAAALEHFADGRLLRSRLAGEALQWATLSSQVSRVFPIALLILFATGAYMVASAWSWSAGWVDAAIGGVVVLFAGGAYVGSQVAALRRALSSNPEEPVSAQAWQLAHNPITHALSYGTTTLAIGIVFIMVTKPGLLVAILALIVAIALGVGIGQAQQRREQKSAPEAPRSESGAHQPV